MKDAMLHVFERLLSETKFLYPDFIKALNSYVHDPRTLDHEQIWLMIDFVRSQTLPRSMRLERIERRDPDWNVGDPVELKLKSFTQKRPSENDRMGHIGWKSSDEAIVVIENALRGYEIDYDLIKVWFSASEEKEVIVSGMYRVSAKRSIVEPGTRPEYGYRIPMYVLTEI